MEDLSNKIAITFLGRSGSGKGTQVVRVVEYLGKDAYRIETGKILRTLAQKNNPTADFIKHILESGQFVPFWLTVFLWTRELVEEGVANRHLILDGSPRMLMEAKTFDDVMEAHKRPLPIGVYIDVDEAEVTKRLLLRGRADDSESTIKNRMKSFEQHVFPIIDYYKKDGRLIHVNGNGTPGEVWARLSNALKERLKEVWPSP
ncbi:MAG: nucleoside monophosphate kinase [Candidatus Sungbacteria bacterium]|nr:nucleoside monophosphate kinase [Candidatus Sungbacteria bacterium]